MTKWQSMFAVASAALLAFAAPAQAEPPGSYRESCRDFVTSYENVLTAVCRTMNGEERRSTLSLPGCRGDIANDDGRLTCRDRLGRARYGNWQDVQDEDGNDGYSDAVPDRFGNNNSNADRYDNDRWRNGDNDWRNDGDDNDGDRNDDRFGNDDRGDYTPPRPITPPPEARRLPSPVIYVYDDINYRGRGLTFRTSIPNLSVFGFNDRISSAYTPSWRQWVVCTDKNYRGRCVRINDIRDLRRINMNNRISSMYPAR